MNLNRMNTTKNRYQGDYKKVLCVCSAGCLRSPTAAVVLSQEPFNFNTRACGIDIGFAIIPLDEVLIEWADEIVCMDAWQKKQLEALTKKPIINMDIGDIYEYRNHELMKIIKEKYLAGTSKRS
jgi:predicted protein tyrosine phosphatase